MRRNKMINLKKPKVSQVGIRVNKELYDKLRKYCRIHGITIRAAIEFGMEQFIIKIKEE